MASNSVKDEKVHNTEKMTIHQREDSESELEALFSYGLNATKHKLVSIPMKQRHLPPSFFTPPTVGTKSPSVHSRENSLDNTGPFSPGPAASPHPPLQQPSGNPSGHHSRANSCPATLGQTLAVAQQHQVNKKHELPFYLHPPPLLWCDPKLPIMVDIVTRRLKADQSPMIENVFN